MFDGMDVAAGTRAAVQLCDAYLEVLSTCRDHLLQALAVLEPSMVAADGGGDGMAPQPSVPPVLHLAVATANPAGAAALIRKSAAAAVSKPPAPAKKKTGPAPSRPPVKPAAGRSGTPDYAAIAADIIALRASGQPVAAALAAKWRVPVSTARNWPGKCRRLGLLPDEKHVPIRVVEDNTGPVEDAIPFDVRLVAETYLGAVRLGERPVQAVADRFNITHPMAQAFINRARAAGALPPPNEPQLPDDERKALLDEYKPAPFA